MPLSGLRGRLKRSVFPVKRVNSRRKPHLAAKSPRPLANNAFVIKYLGYPRPAHRRHCNREFSAAENRENCHNREITGKRQRWSGRGASNYRGSYALILAQ